MQILKRSLTLRFVALPVCAISAAASVALAPLPVATTVRLTVATLHAAKLSSSDSIEQPYFLVSIAGPRGTSTLQLPNDGHLRIHTDEALGARPLTDLRLVPGDTARVLVSVLTGAVRASEEKVAAAASTRALAGPPAKLAEQLSSALSAMTTGGAHWLGSATLSVTNDNGTIYWKSLDCVASCSVLSGAASKALSAAGAPVQGVV